ncbi:hypothetical protein SAMN04487996_105262 [Dyadobacter soli]|uniref:Uncharacterized protein n=1 Tax=Dyadobacter soli TaxID=659014 RepID=A0A1G7DJV8_9BACT|nr:hypothetical protein [Dyadobacter soli]SDE51811.1 hypothetical protein SAMN04487996_105262 [Dyadobacter soli]
MAQLLQMLYYIAPILAVVTLVGAAAGGLWLVVDLKKRSTYNRYTLSDRLFLKRNADRLRKVQLH